MSEHKPSFLKTLFNAAVGYFKGFLAGGLIGGIAGGLIGTIAGAITGNYAFALAGAQIGGGMLASVGGITGIVTGVARSREAGMVPTEDALNAVKVAYAQGMAVEQHRQKEWGAHILQERANKVTIDAGQRLHS